MSQENLDAFREVIEEINERGPDARLDLFDSEVEFHEDPSFPEAKVYRGRDEIMGNFRAFTEAFDSYCFEIDDLRDAGGGKVVAVLREQARGRASGVRVDRRSGWLFTFRDGKVLRMEIYLEPLEALKAVGLPG
jgi:ketosteroid isomerase-like protein